MTPFAIVMPFRFKAAFENKGIRNMVVDKTVHPTLEAAKAYAIETLEAENQDKVTSLEEVDSGLAGILSEIDMVAKAMKAELVKPCLMLELFHGRDNPEQDMEDFGYDGPTLNNLEFCHITYMAHLSIDRDEGPIFTALTFDTDMLRLILRQSDAEELKMADKGQAFDLEGVPCRVYWFGDWELALSK